MLLVPDCIKSLHGRESVCGRRRKKKDIPAGRAALLSIISAARRVLRMLLF